MKRVNFVQTFPDWVMRALLLITCGCILSLSIAAQSFEVSGTQESYRGHIGELIKAPITLKNTTTKPIYLVIRRVSSQLGSTQKSFLNVSGNNVDPGLEEYTIKLEPGQSNANLAITLETGLVAEFSSVKYSIFNKNNPADVFTMDLNFITDERSEARNIYSSPSLIVYDIYPNPVSDQATMQYQILKERVKAKIIIHNVLGNPLSEYPLAAQETKLKIQADELSSGIYFYTLYLENDAVLTRKLIVKK